MMWQTTSPPPPKKSKPKKRPLAPHLRLNYGNRQICNTFFTIPLVTNLNCYVLQGQHKRGFRKTPSLPFFPPKKKMPDIAANLWDTQKSFVLEPNQAQNHFMQASSSGME